MTIASNVCTPHLLVCVCISQRQQSRESSPCANEYNPCTMSPVTSICRLVQLSATDHMSTDAVKQLWTRSCKDFSNLVYSC